MPLTRDTFTQVGVASPDFLVGPAVVLIQDSANFAFSGVTATGFPTGLDDIVDMTTGLAKTANGWSYVGYTDGVSLGRQEKTIYLDADQQARVEEVLDVWEGEVQFKLLETRLSLIQKIWSGDPGGPAALGGTPTTAQNRLGLGAPSAIKYRRVCVLHPDKNGFVWGFVYAKSHLMVTGAPKFTRTARVEWDVKGSILPDTRIADIQARMMVIYQTAAAVLT